VTGKEGWWDSLVGPGKVLDPARYFIICVNVLGHCMGTTGPLARDPATGEPWNLRFPVVTIRDMVRAQAPPRPSRYRQALRRDRRVDGRHAGARVGGALRRARALRDPDRDRRMAFGSEHRFHEVGRQA
jgi:hypothetical protein